MIYCANCGDSRSVLCRNGTCIELNVCHNVNNEKEVQRIKDAGGCKSLEFLNCRYIMTDRVMGIMQVTRSIGDIEYKTMKEYYWHSEFKADLITSVPDICKEHRMRGVSNR